MDHLWLDQQAQRPPEHVSVLEYVIYDGLGVSGFLGRHGTDQEDLICAISQPYYKTEHQGEDDRIEQRHKKAFWILSVFQEWAFFGLLIDFVSLFGVRITREELIKDDGFERVACTEKLSEITMRLMAAYCNTVFSSEQCARLSHSLIQDVQKTYELEPLPYAEEIAKKTDTMLSQVCTVLRKSVAVRDYSFLPETPKLFWLSAVVMTETVAELAKLLLGPSRVKFDDYAVFAGDADYFLFRDCGLCPSRFTTASTLTISESYILYLAMRRLDQRHDACTYRHCLNITDYDIEVSTPLKRKSDTDGS